MNRNFTYGDKSPYWRAGDGQTDGTFYRTGLPADDTKSATTLLTVSGPDTAGHSANTCWIGTDESGKGDYFGPLIIAGVVVCLDRQADLLDLEVRDSKELYDATIRHLAPQIKRLCPHSVVTINPKLYNFLYAGMENLNRLLAWGHARVIENLLSNHPCRLALTDQFGPERHLRTALMDKGRLITVIQESHAERDLAVAAASILAREAYLTGLESLCSTFHFNLPKGAGRSVIAAGRRFVSRFGAAKLAEVGKEHFITTDSILNPDSQPSSS